MRTSIQTKLFILCILLILITAAGLSITYYMRTKQDKQRESQQRIQIAFDIMLDDLNQQRQFYLQRCAEFVKQSRVEWTFFTYHDDHAQWASPLTILSYPLMVIGQLKEFKELVSASRLALYGADKRLLVIYQRRAAQDIYGVYATSGTGQSSFLQIDPSQTTNTDILSNNTIPDFPLPEDLAATYAGEIPAQATITPFSQAGRLGWQLVLPVYRKETLVGALVGDFLLTQAMAARYAALSGTEVNFFTGKQWSVGTLAAQTELAPEALAQMASCEEIRTKTRGVTVSPLTLATQSFYQGQCAFADAAGKAVGAITVNLSQAIEQREVRKILLDVLAISALVIAAALGLLVLATRKTLQAIANIVRVIGAAAEGDLRPMAISTTRDEIGMLALKLNQMIAQLRAISGQVQAASQAVDGTADAILEQMDTLIRHMEQQAASVENTTLSVEKIKQFMASVAQNTNTLLTIVAQVLSSIQQTRASIGEVTTSTNALTTDLHLISGAVEQVSQAMKQIAEHTGDLQTVAQQTEAETRSIDQSFGEVSRNAEQTQQLAQETMHAATQGQVSVEASLRGMTELKDGVANIAQIIQEVNGWTEQVSAILDIVDHITEQTSLLALNASIISAQAGAHGRGFAVVADEIKELATRTKASTKEIGTLIRKLQAKTAEGVKHTADGLKKADQEMHLAHAVQAALTTILASATRSSNRAADTVQVIQQTANSSQAINAQMKRVIEMVAKIGAAIQAEEQNIEQVVEAVENISGLSEQVNRASIEQQKTTEDIECNMEEITTKFEGIAGQTDELNRNAEQIVAAMHTVAATTEQLLLNGTNISSETVQNLVQQADTLQKIVKLLKVT